MKNNLAIVTDTKNQLEQVFNFGATRIRTVAIDGEPWFVGKDVAKILDFSETTAMTRHLDEDEFMSVKLTGMNMK